MEREIKIVKYIVHKYSSYSSNYFPENIYVDKPHDQSSRWSSDSYNPPQFLILKLDKPAILESITFGKYEKTHVCNLKKFIVYGGLSEDHLVLIFEGGLKSDSIPETFILNNTIGENHFPCRYVKIVPLEAWGPNFNFSIWFIELKGSDDPAFVASCMNWYNTYREREVVRLCLKHFRQNNYTEAYEALQKKTKVALEHPLLTELHDKLVLKGDYEASEKLMQDACEGGLFCNYISSIDYHPQWHLLQNTGNANAHPGMRGGHQMVIDFYTEILYLFGGWDGNEDLSDMWSYHVPSNQWTCISKNTEEDGGPSPRSCHKMCIDYERKKIFLLGRYLDSSTVSKGNVKADFYMYDIWTGRWTLITEDTAAMGGPGLIFDHQLSIDVPTQIIYIFGGRNLSTDKDGECRHELSGLYSYHVPTNTWTLLRDDCSELPSRIGHSMVFHTRRRLLYIFGGQRVKELLTDLLTYDVDNSVISVVDDGSRKDINQMPDASFTQRSTIDPDLNEIYVFSGLSKDKEKRDNVKNAFWVYDIDKNKWFCVYQNTNRNSDKKSSSHPLPRFAHQLVYDHQRKVHYMFGGTSPKDSVSNMRLDDLWSLHLQRPSSQCLLRRCQFLIRKAQFSEMAVTNPVEALKFLQMTLSLVVDHENQEESKQFHSLTSLLFKNESTDSSLTQNNFQQRTIIYDQLVNYFPLHMTQPKMNLVDYITL